MVSVIVPVYQVEKYIKSCIISLLKQTYSDIEIIVVNDGTKDDSIRIAEKLLSKGKIKYKIINKENGGLSSARNCGLIVSSGEYVAFVDSDDTVQEEYVETLINGAKKMNTDISIGMFQMIKNGDTPKNIQSLPDYIYLSRENTLNDFLYRRITPAPWCVLYRKSFLIENGLKFNENVKFSEDQEFFWRAFNVSKGISYTDRIIYNYYIRKGSITTDPKLTKIMSGYLAIKSIAKKIDFGDTNINKYLLARWVMGTLHNTAKYCSRDFYIEMYNAMKAQKLLKQLYSFEDIKARVLSKICVASPIVSYYLFRKV